MSWLAGFRRPTPAIQQRPAPTRLKLFVVMPLTMGLLVAATGYFAASISRSVHLSYGLYGAETLRRLEQLNVQLVMIAMIAAILGFGIAFGVATPLRAFADRLEAVRSGDLQASFDDRSTPEVEGLAGAFNEALSSVNRYLFQSMTGAVITLGSDGRVLGSSPAAEIVLGYREEEIVGKRFSDVFAPATSGRAALAALEAAVTQRKPIPPEEIFIATKQGRRIRIDVSVSYLRRSSRPGGRGAASGGNPDDEVIAVTIGFKDLDEVRRLRDHLRKADQLMALGTVTAGVAHELRNPLASMRGLTELLGRDFPREDPRRSYLSTMLDAIDRLNVLVENLLLLSSDVAPGSEQVEAASLVREVADFVAIGLGDRRLTIDTAVDDAPPGLMVRCSRNRLVQALSNILLNAVQATPDGGTVTVGMVCTDRFVAIRVHNTGSYIPPDVMRSLFVPFFTTKPNGTGLGLAIARQIVTAFNGRIDVESDPAAGTTFTIELPAVAGGADASQAERAGMASLAAPA